MSSLLPIYQDFVLKKEAPIAPPAPQDLRLLHVALGLATEVLELDQSTSRANTLEELGDLIWYAILGTHVLHIPLDSLVEEVRIQNQNSLTIDALKEDIEGFVSLVKKQAIYGSDRLEAIKNQFQQVWLSLLAHCSCCSTDLNYLISTNMEKLDERYKSSFTTEESESRRDKCGERSAPLPETD